MLLVLEIGLTIAAWRRGWKAWALLPLVVAGVAAFLFGFIMATSGASGDGVLAMGLMFDLVCIGALIGMVAKPRKKTQRVESGQASEVTAIEVR